MTDWKEIEKATRDQGWELGRTSKGHRRFIPPDPKAPIVVGPGTASDWRSFKNTLAELRRSGLVWPPPDPRRKDADDRMERSA